MRISNRAESEPHRKTTVGAGLPAMQTPRSIRQTEVMLSQASQLPQRCPRSALWAALDYSALSLAWCFTMISTKR
ncbi:hypothetical protein DJ480_21660 [Pseudomonas sp. Leaf98]|nr:hypothetical protein DJ480_21660 [Pseudomonas sp. Leaf98]